MRRFVPLFVDVRVASTFGTSLGGQKEIGGNQVAGIGLDGGGEEWPIGAAAFLIHTGRRRGVGFSPDSPGWVDSAGSILPQWEIAD